MSHSDEKIIIATGGAGAILTLLKQIESDKGLIFTTAGEPLAEETLELLEVKVRETLATRDLSATDVLSLVEQVEDEEFPVLALLNELFRPQKGLELFAAMETPRFSDFPVIRLLKERPHWAFENGAEIRSAKGARKKQTRFKT